MLVHIHIMILHRDSLRGSGQNGATRGVTLGHSRLKGFGTKCYLENEVAKKINKKSDKNADGLGHGASSGGCVYHQAQWRNPEPSDVPRRIK